MNKYIFLAFLLIINNLVYSNESRAVLGSTVEVLDNENTNIAMREEEIIITLQEDYYEVTVNFVFYNEGPEEEVLMAFPVESTYQPFEGNKEWAVVRDFQTFINGNLVTEFETRETIERRGECEYDYLTHTIWYIRNVTFPANQITNTTVTYKVPYNNFGFFYYAGYIYGTGRSWKGPIGKMTVIVNHDDNIIIKSVNFGNNHSPVFIWEGNGKYSYVMENLKPEINSRIRIEIQHFDIYDYGNEFGSWAEGWIWNEMLLYSDFSSIELYTKSQIRLFINCFYAFHGYEFKDPFYRYYFKDFEFSDRKNTRYIVNPDFSEGDFNEFERKNIDYLLNIEKMIPFSENDSIEFERRKAEYLLNFEKMTPLEDNNKSFNIRAGKYIVIIAIIMVILLFVIRKMTFLTGKRRKP